MMTLIRFLLWSRAVQLHLEVTAEERGGGGLSSLDEIQPLASHRIGDTKLSCWCHCETPPAH